MDKHYPTISFDQIQEKIPPYLFKYYSLVERNVSAVIANKVFVSSPDQLNDLFDTLFLRIKVHPNQMSIYRSLVEFKGLEFDADRFMTSNEFRIELRNTLFAIWNSSIGILSTTDDSLNDLMWAHYTNNEGFLVQFDYTKFPKNFGGPIPISYLTNEEFQHEKNENLFEELFINALQKKKIWNYENEYRFLVSPKYENYFMTTGRFSNEDYQNLKKESRLQDYPPDCIKKVMLGFNFFRKLMTSNDRIDFSKPSGLLRKSLIDWALEKKIDIEIIFLDFKKMELLPRKFNLKRKSDLEYEIEYAR